MNLSLIYPWAWTTAIFAAYVAVLFATSKYAPKFRGVVSEFSWVGIVVITAVSGLTAPASDFDDFWFRAAFGMVGWVVIVSARDLIKEIRAYQKG